MEGPVTVLRENLILFAGGLVLTLLVLLLLVPHSSRAPDGLERFTITENFTEAENHPWRDTGLAVFPGYSIPGIDNVVVAKVLAGLLGTLLIGTTMLGVGWALRYRMRDGDVPEECPERDGPINANVASRSRRP